VPEGKLKKFVSDSYIGKDVIMGIRPENIHDEEIFLSNASDSSIGVAVEIVELMGSETYLYLKTSGKDDNIIARVDPRSTARGGDKIRVAFDANRLHFFDPETFNTILNR
jgi:multiple sugar transport system ATP-binding protein